MSKILVIFIGVFIGGALVVKAANEKAIRRLREEKAVCEPICSPYPVLSLDGSKCVCSIATEYRDAK